MACGSISQFCELSCVVADPHSLPRTGLECGVFHTISFGVQELARESFPLHTWSSWTLSPHPCLIYGKLLGLSSPCQDDQSGPRVITCFRKRKSSLLLLLHTSIWPFHLTTAALSFLFLVPSQTHRTPTHE